MDKNNQIMKDGGELKRELGVWSATAIVVGNIIGSAIFMSPASFARVTNPKVAILAWILTMIGSLFIALSFANLGSKMPKTGGPIVYTRAAFGDFAGFLIAWTFWIGSWVGISAIITAFMSYFTYFVPAANNPMWAFIISSAVVWIFTFINIIGVKYVGKIGVVSIILKVAVLGAFIVVALLHFDPSFMNTVSSPQVAGIGTLPAAIAVALWAFVGLESATVAGGEIKNPEKNIKISTILGILIVGAIYISVSIASMGALDQATLASSNAPMANIIDASTGGKWGGTFVAIGAIISTLGAACGWVLIAARSAVGAAEDGLFPKIFKRVNPKHNTPVASLIISAICMNLLLLMNYVGTLQSVFDFMIALATLAFLPAYSFTAAAEIVLLCKRSKDFSLVNFLKSSFFSLLAFAYSIYAIYGTGGEIVMYGFILMLVGIPVYVYMMMQKNKETKNIDELRKSAGLEE